MPRPPRLLIANLPYHIVQRGHRRQIVFESAGDHRAYLNNLRLFSRNFGIAVHAWCLMPNHVHLLLSPTQDPRALSALMQRLARAATCRWNARKHTTGSIWEARFKAREVHEEKYLLECCRYIELNPVRAGLVKAPASYPWSSYRERLGVTPQHMLDHHALYLAMGRDDTGRRAAYRHFVESGLPSSPGGYL